MMNNKPQDLSRCEYPLDRLVEIMAELRGEQGCPWDKEQTPQSIKKYLIEETYEVIAALDSGDQAKVCDELGDVLLQVVFHAQMAAEEKQFNIKDVIATVIEKMIRRHPHVFGNTTAKNSQEVLVNWDKIKAKEQSGPGEARSLLANIPKCLPALIRSAKLQAKVAQVGFDWPDFKGEGTHRYTECPHQLKELDVAIERGQESEITAELGDIIFAVVNVARLLKIDAEEALTTTNERFQQRFLYLEQKSNEQGKLLADMSLKEMDDLWQQAKCLEKKQNGKHNQ
ncbi:MAG: nucleoside triphosphate pyrophosphohydrolase [Desulfotomaculum sp.]|nr:nucleoside triphosphate pyrophosphohydrolase [Desulfotomaculum sp.]